MFTYLHLAAEPELTKALIEKEVTAIAYETVQVGRTLPLLTPTSEVAGRMSAQIGAQFLEKTKGGKGILLSGVPGVNKAIVENHALVGLNTASCSVTYEAVARDLGYDYVPPKEALAKVKALN